MRNLHCAAMTAACLLLAPFANAAVVSFDFTGTTGEASSMSFTQDGVTVTATGGAAVTSPAPGLVTGNAGGLGIIGSLDVVRELNARAGGLSGFANFIQLAFDREVTLLSLDFESFDAFDNVGLSVEETFLGIGSADPFLVSDVFTLDELTGRIFLVQAVSSGFIPVQSSFLLAGATVETVGSAVIPLPAGLPLYAVALGLLALARRRQGHVTVTIL